MHSLRVGVAEPTPQLPLFPSQACMPKNLSVTLPPSKQSTAASQDVENGAAEPTLQEVSLCLHTYPGVLLR
jgi:hypothetical protein